MKCPKCKRQWEHDSEQSICTELYGECLSCKRHTLKQSELDKVLSTQKERRASYYPGGKK